MTRLLDRVTSRITLGCYILDQAFCALQATRRIWESSCRALTRAGHYIVGAYPSPPPPTHSKDILPIRCRLSSLKGLLEGLFTTPSSPATK